MTDSGARSRLTVAEMITFSAVKLSRWAGGQQAGSGTGFFYVVDLGNDRVMNLVVTNKHVISNADRLSFHVHLAVGTHDFSDSGRVEAVSLPVDDRHVVMHPDPDVDLCAVVWSGEYERLVRSSGTVPYYAAFDRFNVPTDVQWQDFDAIETLTMAGYPNGLGDELNHFPLVRQGISASRLDKRHGGKPHFVVDMACFPGSSGSPIFVRDQIGHIAKRTGTFYPGRNRFFLVGILFSGPTIDQRGRIILDAEPSVSVASMMHLGNAIRSSELLAIDTLVLARASDGSIATSVRSA